MIWGDSDPEADDIPKCRHAPLMASNSVTFLKLYVLNFFQGKGERESSAIRPFIISLQLLQHFDINYFLLTNIVEMVNPKTGLSR